jgi:hypothetical protein
MVRPSTPGRVVVVVRGQDAHRVNGRARLLGFGGERRARRPPAKVPMNARRSSYSITWSARSRSDGGIVRPRGLAVWRLMTRSSFVGRWTGRSPGVAPFRILST